MKNPNASPILRRRFGLSSFGRSAEVRTLGLVVPNHARYQLRHTPILFYFLILLFSRKISVFRFALPTFGQKHCRTARLVRFALLCVSSCSSIAFFRHRRRQCPSHHTPILFVYKSYIFYYIHGIKSIINFNKFGIP